MTRDELLGKYPQAHDLPVWGYRRWWRGGFVVTARGRAVARCSFEHEAQTLMREMNRRQVGSAVSCATAATM